MECEERERDDRFVIAAAVTLGLDSQPLGCEQHNLPHPVIKTLILCCLPVPPVLHFIFPSLISFGMRCRMVSVSDLCNGFNVMLEIHIGVIQSTLILYPYSHSV